MKVINVLLGVPLGYLFYGCYLLVDNLGVAVLLFTVAVKVVLLPLSLLAQKNAITMVRLTPRLEDLKRRYEGNNAQLMEEQKKLYSQEHYSNWISILPMLIQIPIILGLINVIYNPLQHLLHFGADLNDSLVAAVSQFRGISVDELGSGAQLAVLETAHNTPDVLSGVLASTPDGSGILAQMQAVNLQFLGIDLASVPSFGSFSIIYPILSALSALALCLYQNKYYVLSVTQGNVSKWGTTIFLVAFSGYFAFVLPCGLGLYWTAGNLLSIAVVWVSNLILPPGKYIDYSLIDIKPVLTREQKVAQRARKRELHKRETADIKRFNSVSGKQLMFYSEGSGYYKYYERMISWLLANSDVVIHYVTNDPNDQVFAVAEANPKLKCYYVGPTAFISFMMKLDVDMVVMTTPCLEKYHIKRSLVRKDIEYVYTDHGMGSFHLALPEGAVDSFDTVFCYGPNHIEEVRQTEEVYDLPEKRLVRTGFGLLDNILERVADEEMPENDPKSVLIAPSWQAENLLDEGVDEVIDSLLDHGYKVIVRPHPEYVKRFSNRMDAIVNRFADAPADRLEFQLDFSSNSTVYTSDIVITDWSSIATEFSYATKKPSIFINTPLKVMNHNYQRIEAVPREILMRDEVGVSVDMDELARVGDIADELLADQANWNDTVTQVMTENIFNIGTSGEASGQYILAALADIRRSKR